MSSCSCFESGPNVPVGCASCSPSPSASPREAKEDSEEREAVLEIKGRDMVDGSKEGWEDVTLARLGNKHSTRIKQNTSSRDRF